MSGFGQFCPVAVACEIFAERWTPLILRELFAGSRRYNEIHRGVPLMSPTLLTKRLRRLEQLGIVQSTASGSQKGGREYRLTDAGQEFWDAIQSLGTWGQRWTVRVGVQNLDAGFLMWDMQRRIATDRLPDRRLVVQFDFRGVPASDRRPKRFWLVLQRSEVDLCLKDPGFDIDLHVNADLRALTEVWLGDRSWRDALASGHIHLEGPRALTDAFPSWLLLGYFNAVERPRRDKAVASASR